MRTLFIADLHLSEHQPAVTDAFFSFLNNETENVDALYLLGDLFEVWIGDDEHTPLMDEVAARLSAYAQSNNIKLYYIHGNRDFMIGKKYAAQASMNLLPEHSAISLNGENVLVMHGDTLCLADKNYQKMRTVIHNPFLQLIFNLLPLSLRKKIGWKIRTASQSKKVYKNREMMGVTQAEVLRLMEKYQCQTLIHGHTHQAAEHNFLLADKAARRFDVGDWSKNLSFVEAQKGQISLITRPIDYYTQ
ncbi:UDP-2,3-diacylglucosamine diphosphatase [Psychromonas ossibalaenae]|uniref:UDP-2,3-diacylglucosamine diphosphatase n=1 Tax=Psychromonas ossibalaenae TaxID=444922 RepID=UPI0003795D09|nr:UDP-2,3-diacylglucosamine diphosphatase [Psychromonas ossibalaenae]